MKRIRAKFECKLEDCWVGVFWRQSNGVLHLWICLLPCLPLHVQVGRREGYVAHSPHRRLAEAATDEELATRYAEEVLKLKKINHWTLEGKKNGGSARARGISPEEAYGPRPCEYPDTAMMNVCKRELERRGLPVPEVSLPEE
jgi:hypothetical protein